MNVQKTAEIVQLQQRIVDRLTELGYADSGSAQRIARHVAEIAIKGRQFSETTLPLLLTMNAENDAALAQLVVSIKCDLDDIGDAIQDVKRDLEDVIDLLNHGRSDS